MRWEEPKHGDTTTKRKFALFPIEINGESRWLEMVTIKYVYEKHGRPYKDSSGNNFVRRGWIVEGFVD